MPVDQNRLSTIMNSSRNKSLLFNRLSYGRVNPADPPQNFAHDVLERVRNLPSEGISIANERRDKLVAFFKEQSKKFFVLDFPKKSKTRFLVGSGSPSPYEVGFFFDRNYGLPVIPGTGLKGAFYHFLEEKSFDPDALRRWFGFSDEDSQAARGSITFLDAIPKEMPQLELDIVNPHFPDYYRYDPETGAGNVAPPNDWYNPIPVGYIVVGAGTQMRFTLVFHNREINREERQTIEQEFQQMLKYWGVGAKTAYGYGRF
ncbi:MAG TPA: type III-B CRISPR module RAMP protein Cmr6 [Thermotogota bacterium]|nr:type III-B CRISPR module RAMP protein Cmr6 [Thermotogota bacterium]